MKPLSRPQRVVIGFGLVAVIACLTLTVLNTPGCRASFRVTDSPAVSGEDRPQHRLPAGEAGTSGGTTVEIDGKRVVAPAGSRVSVVTEEVGEDRETTTKSEGHGDDPTASATEKAAKSAGGATDYAGLASLLDAAAAGDPKYLSIVVIGALLIAAGLVAMLWLGQKSLGLGLMAGGGAMVALGVVADASPWVFAAIIGVAALGAVLFIVHARLAKSDGSALAAIVPAVEANDPNSTTGLKAAIERNAGGAVKAVRAAVRRVKAKTLGPQPAAPQTAGIPTGNTGTSAA